MFSEFVEVLGLVISLDLVLEQVGIVISIYGAVYEAGAYMSLVIETISSIGSLLWDTFQTLRYRYHLKKEREYMKKRAAWNVKQSARIMHILTVIAAGAGVVWNETIAKANDHMSDSQYSEGDITGQLALYLNGLLAVAGGSADALEWLFPLLLMPMFGDIVTNCVANIAGNGCEKCWESMIEKVDVRKTAPLSLFLMCTYGSAVAWKDAYDNRYSGFGSSFLLTFPLAAFITGLLVVAFVLGWGFICLLLRCAGPPPDKEQQSNNSTQNEVEGQPENERSVKTPK